MKIFSGIFRGNRQLEKAIRDVGTDLASLQTALNSVITGQESDYLDQTVTLSEGSTPQNVATTAFEFHVNNVEYEKAAVAAGTALSGDNIVAAKYGAWALDIGVNGTIDITEATGNADPSYDSAALAIAGLPAVAADHVRLGWVTASKSDGVFDPGTTSLADAQTTEAYVSATAGVSVPSSVSLLTS